MPAKIYYIRRNATAQLPTNILFLDTETKAETVDGDELHCMYLAVTWRVTTNTAGQIHRERWETWQTRAELCAYVCAECRSKAPLYVIGSNITFDLFAIDLLSYLSENGWSLKSLYDKGLVTILITSKDDRTLKICAAQNWLQGSVREWGELLGLEKGVVDFANDTPETVEEYCRRDVEITGKAFLSYLDFLRRHDMGGFALTVAGQAFRCYRHRFMKPKSILHYDQYTYNAFTRAAYFGGRVECGYIGSKRGAYTKLDINSMYPHVMREQLYPGKVRQWVRDIDLETFSRKVQGACCIAEVVVDTDEPAYAVKRNGKLTFPVGRFITFLSTGSVRYALERGHIARVRQCMTFDAVDLFSSYVDYFYPLKARYTEEENGVWTKTVKLILNGLYGKFGEKRAREILREDTPGSPVFRREGLYSRDGLDMVEPSFDWRYDNLSPDHSEYVRGVEYSLLNTTITEVGDDEGPGSAPAIAAHVTDYARMLLYDYIRIVGVDRVLYCDTDSLIIHTEDLAKLKEVMDDEALGKLKTEGNATTVEFRGPKDYSFGADLRRKGIRSNAQLVCRRCREHIEPSDRECQNCGDLVSTPAFTQDSFPGFYSLLRRGLSGGFPVGTITKSLAATYTKGVVAVNGAVSPHHLSE